MIDMFPKGRSIVHLTDSYKYGHHLQLPPKTTRIYSYLESRGSREGFDEVVFFGLQGYLKRYLVGQVVTQEDIDLRAKRNLAHFGYDFFDRTGWEKILHKHGGKLPLSIRAIPEGTVLDTHNALITIEGLDDDLPAITNFIETTILHPGWNGTTVASYSREIKKIIKRYMELSCDTLDKLPYMLHDFGMRGASSVETGETSGAAHLVNFQGTDTTSALDYVMEYYGPEDEMPGVSVVASEHMTITSWGKEHEVDAYRNLLHKFPNGVLACVSDSYDIFNACANIWGDTLRDEVIARNSTPGNQLVIRPDSGIPHAVVLECLYILSEKFGFTTNTKGYKVLNHGVRLIQGDGVNIHSIEKICQVITHAGFSMDNIGFGCGGALLQQHDRDEYQMAIKCSQATIDGVDRDVFKSPITDSGKNSKKGKLMVTLENGVYQTIPYDSTKEDQLVEVYRSGELLIDWNFNEIRERARL
jgi:nicotinamide phosphoribosyltransferase